VRRFFRIFPALLSSVLLTMVADAVRRGPISCPNPKWFTNFFIFNNFPGWGGAETVTCLRQTWSVGLEFQLYIATPFLFMAASALSSLNTRFSTSWWVAALCCVGWVVCCALRLHFVMAMDMVGQPPNIWWSLWHFYQPTQFRFSTYLAGVVAGVFVAGQRASPEVSPMRAPTRWAGCAASVALVLSGAVLASSCVFGGDLQAVADPATTAWYRIHLSWLAVLHEAFLRPLIGAAVACVLSLCTLGHAPRVAHALSLPCWRHVAGLSYSIYLLQNIGFDLLMRPFLVLVAGSMGTAPLWLSIASAYLAALLFIAGCIPLAYLNYALVEYPGIQLGRLVFERMQRSGRKTGFAAVPANGRHLEVDGTCKSKKGGVDLEDGLVHCSSMASTASTAEPDSDDTPQSVARVRLSFGSE